MNVLDTTYYEHATPTDSIYNLYSEHKIKITLNHGDNYYVDSEEQISLKNGDQNVDFTFTSYSNYVTVEFTAPKESSNLILNVAPKVFAQCKINNCYRKRKIY